MIPKVKIVIECNPASKSAFEKLLKTAEYYGFIRDTNRPIHIKIVPIAIWAVFGTGYASIMQYIQPLPGVHKVYEEGKQ